MYYTDALCRRAEIISSDDYSGLTNDRGASIIIICIRTTDGFIVCGGEHNNMSTARISHQCPVDVFAGMPE